MEIFEELRNIRLKIGLNQTDMAKKIGIPQKTWSNYERGRSNPPLKVLMKLAEMGYEIKGLTTSTIKDMGIAEEEAREKRQIGKILNPELSIENAEKIISEHYNPIKNAFLIPILDQKLSAGGGCDLPENDKPVAYISAPKNLSKYGKNLAALYVDGDSMEPTLNRGDMIVCDSCGWNGEGIYAIQMDGNGFVKRIARKPGKIVIISDNPIYEPFEILLEDESVRIIGRVHCVLHNVD